MPPTYTNMSTPPDHGSKTPRQCRIEQALARPFDPSSLIGSYFLSDAERKWQGVVVAEPAPTVYLVELFGWVLGAPIEQLLVPVSAMLDWTFYDTSEWMRDAYDAHIQRKWKDSGKPTTAMK